MTNEINASEARKLMKERINLRNKEYKSVFETAVYLTNYQIKEDATNGFDKVECDMNLLFQNQIQSQEPKSELNGMFDDFVLDMKNYYRDHGYRVYYDGVTMRIIWRDDEIEEQAEDCDCENASHDQDEDAREIKPVIPIGSPEWLYDKMKEIWKIKGVKQRHIEADKAAWECLMQINKDFASSYELFLDMKKWYD